MTQNTNLSTIKIAAGYARTSGDVNPASSIDNQIRTIKRYCEENNIVLKEIFVDDKSSILFLSHD